VTYYDQELASLRHHWGHGAYVIHHWPLIGLWLAQRCDTGETLKSDDPGELRRLIHADYRARPVPR